MTKPSPIALVVCDNVYRESSGKTALVGLFNNIAVTRLPAVYPRMCVYASVTEVHPGTTFTIEVVNGETDQVVASLRSTPAPEQTDPTTIFDFNFVLDDLQFAEAGLYYIQFWGNDYLLLQRPFRVQSRERGVDHES